jgi:HD-GYP domain-containing protein (c-di-GMP phosphodiesterase class II)
LSITIIKHLPTLNHVIPSVIGHHERWDGKGYPRGLKGENIPFSARCLAIADAFDALTSNRPYRAGLTINSALAEIKNNLGTQFDPAMANLFIKLVQDGTIKVCQTGGDQKHQLILPCLFKHWQAFALNPSMLPLVQYLFSFTTIANG